MRLVQTLIVVWGISFVPACQRGKKTEQRSGANQPAIEASQANETLDLWCKKPTPQKLTCLPPSAFPNFGFNVLVYGNMNHKRSDVGGSLAVGQDVTLEDYLIGSSLTPDTSRVDLLAGGNLQFTRGEVRSGATVYGGIATVTDVKFSGGVFQSPAYFAFDKASSWARILTASLARYPMTGQIQITGAGPTYLVSLVGTQSQLNVFTLDASQLATAYGLQITAPAGSSVLINVTGNIVKMQAFGFALNGVTAKDVFFNMANATQLLMEAIGVMGSILAPYADTTFNNGAIDGFVVAQSMQGTGEFHWVPFQGCLPWGGHPSKSKRSNHSKPVLSPE